MGENSVASGYISTAMGESTSASSDYTVAMGYGTVASGPSSTAMGYNTIASGSTSTAIGDFTVASGQNSTAMGKRVSTNLKWGSFVMGDASTATYMNSSADQEFSARFSGGYRLFSNTSLTSGVTLAAGGGAWASVSDKNKKENFIELNAEDILLKIKDMPVTEWNYKTQDHNIHHIGPMAQDFYAQFKLGGKGNDTTITTTDMDGVNMLGIQALEKRTAEMQLIMKEQQVMICQQNVKIETLEKELSASIETNNKINDLIERLNQLEKVPEPMVILVK